MGNSSRKLNTPAIAAVLVLAVAIGVGVGVGVGKGAIDTASSGSGQAAPSASDDAAAQAGSTAPQQSTPAATRAGGISGTVAHEARPSVEYEGQTIQALERPHLVAALPEASQAAAQPAAQTYTPNGSLDGVENLDNENLHLSDGLRSALAANGFAITEAGGFEFWETYERNRYYRIPNFVTVDSMMHTYHLYFAYLMKNTEKGHLLEALTQLTGSMLQESQSQYEQLKGTEWEKAAQRNLAFFAVAQKLLDPAAQVPDSVAGTVDQEVANIMAAEGVQTSAVTEKAEDYTQYIVRGYYEGDEALERYFRTMMWYGHMHFTQNDEELDRSALLVTLALESGSLDLWERIYTVTSFFAGTSDDSSYYEYLPLFQAVYGVDATAADLPGKTGEWERYHALTEQMPAPRINSVVSQNTSTEDEQKGFRFMGQRFTIDAAIMQNLMYDRVGANSQGSARMLPNALDVPAALGSDEALGILESKGQTGYEGYSENMEALRGEFAAAGPETWQASLYSQWLYTLQPLLGQKGEGYPSFMQSQGWTRKNLQTYLGSYTELKHDTVLYAKQAIAEAGGGSIKERDDRGYVEPEPDLFARLANLSRSTSEGLANYGLLGDADRENLSRLQTIAERLAAIAETELAGQMPSESDFELIRDYGAQIEHFWNDVNKDEADNEYFKAMEFPAAIVTDVATDADAGTVLELGTGKASDIYVVVMVDGSPRIARGSVFSFYQFEHPMSDRLTDIAWREMMGISHAMDGNDRPMDPKPREDWVQDLIVE